MSIDLLSYDFEYSQILYGLRNVALTSKAMWVY